jgi:hypothetical protein
MSNTGDANNQQRKKGFFKIATLGGELLQMVVGCMLTKFPKFLQGWHGRLFISVTGQDYKVTIPFIV